MITKLHIKNFKSHKDTELEFAPLTVLTGMNSCGKSSVIQSLLLLRQSKLKNRILDGLELNQPLTSIGSGQDALYCYASEGTISFDLQIDNQMEFKASYNVENAFNESFIPIVNQEKNFMDFSLFNSNFQYLSAMRWGGKSSFPQDTYEVKTGKQISLNFGQGELLGNYLFEFGKEETYNYIDNDGTKMSLVEQAQKWEQKISNGITINVQRDSNQNGFFVTYGMDGVEGRRPISGQKAENIGFGISYSLPIVVALLHAEPDSLIIIENPEAHLHPDGQAIIAQLICAVAQRGVQVIIETHSDHIINGILVGCKRFNNGKTGISKENVRIHFFEPKSNDGSSMCTSINISEQYSVDYQPKGFFDRIENDRNYLFFGE